MKGQGLVQWYFSWTSIIFIKKLAGRLASVPAGTQYQNDVVSTSMRRDFNVVCPLRVIACTLILHMMTYVSRFTLLT